MKSLALLLLLLSVAAMADEDADAIRASDTPVECSAFKAEFTFVQGYRGFAGRPKEAFLRLVAVEGGARHLLNTRTGLVDYVSISNEEQALEFVRLFSREETHYLFDDADFLELPPSSTDKSFWWDEDSVQRARACNVPIDSPTVEVARNGNNYTITRYAMDWSSNLLRVEEVVSTNGVYAIVKRQVLASNIWARMPAYE